MEARGSALLASLIGLIQPIVAAAYSTQPDSQKASTIGFAADRLCDSTEGQDLVQTLERFIGVIIEAHGNNSSINVKETFSDNEEIFVQDSGNLPTASALAESLIAPKESQLSIPRLMEADELPLNVREEVEKHVFNRMPIRVLAFDSHGGQIRLLERNAIVSRILSQIRNQYPVNLTLFNAGDIVIKASRYSILSHTWIRGIPGDVVYGDWATRKLPTNVRGYDKITHFCAVAAREHDVLFGWMDTVCINKDSSSELDESIRSMYKWYRGAYLCVIYLAETSEIKDMHQDPWFTRGWTLQELLAPRKRTFYNREWQALVSLDLIPTSASADPQLTRDWKVRHSLEVEHQIFKATTITAVELRRFDYYPRSVPLSRIMQLAADRKVTRKEDRIYSLMGLLGVVVPIAYGEGSENALKRIIQEIMTSRTRFMDIFNHNHRYSIFPKSIQDYGKRSTVFDEASFKRLNFFLQPDPVLLTHLGVRLTVIAVPAFRKDLYEHVIPLESNSQIFTISHWPCINQGPELYILLDNSHYSAKWTNRFLAVDSSYVSDPATVRHESPNVIFMAIINSCAEQFDDGEYILPNNALCIAISTDNINGEKLADIEPNIQISGPMTLPLPYSTAFNEERFWISKQQGDRLGFKSITRYFT